jgi:hypothetical protein
LPKPVSATVSAIYRAYEANADTENRPHLGASLIGRECSRALWYTFRWCGTERHEGRLLRLFERGQREEAVFAANLRAIGCTVHEVDPRTGEQFRFSGVAGHMGGSMDAAALGVPEAPETWHCCEFKTHNAKSFKDLVDRGVAEAKPEHWCQMQVYMHWSGMTRALYLAVNKDTDELYSERLHYDKAAAEALIEKAQRIILADNPPARLSERPDWYQCKWCQFHAICHEGALPAVNCRTCAHATSELDGEGRWSCYKFRSDIDTATQRQGAQCPGHVFIPALVPWPQTDANEQDGWVEYRAPDGTTVRNGPGFVASVNLHQHSTGA